MTKKPAKTKDMSAKKGKAGQADDDKGLKRAFHRMTQKSPVTPRKPSGEEVDMPRKLKTSGFLSYLRSASNGKDQEAAEQARTIQDTYGQMSVESKKTWWVYSSWLGGKRSGLSTCFKQVVKIKTDCDDRSWCGYLNLGVLMDLWKVPSWIYLGCRVQLEKQKLCLPMSSSPPVFLWDPETLIRLGEPPKNAVIVLWFLFWGWSWFSEYWCAPYRLQMLHFRMRMSRKLGGIPSQSPFLQSTLRRACLMWTTGNWYWDSTIMIRVDRNRVQHQWRNCWREVLGDVAGSSSMLGLEYQEAKKTGKDPSVKHKQAVGKANTLISRLGKQLGVLESSLPAMKKRMGASEMAMVRAGLSQCRDAKEESLGYPWRLQRATTRWELPSFDLWAPPQLTFTAFWAHPSCSRCDKQAQGATH